MTRSSLVWRVITPSPTGARRSIAARGAEALLETLALHLLGAELLLGLRGVEFLRVLVPVDGERTRAGGVGVSGTTRRASRGGFGGFQIVARRHSTMPRNGTGVNENGRGRRTPRRCRSRRPPR